MLQPRRPDQTRRKRGLKTRTGKPVAKSKIATLLQPPVYTGTFTWGGKTYQGKYEALITTALFCEVQDVLAGRSRPRGQLHTYVYTGLLRCGTCSGLMTGEMKKGRYVYYGCRGKKNCRRYYPETAFEHETTRILGLLAVHDEITEWITVDLASWYDETIKADTTTGERLPKRITELQQLKSKNYEDKLPRQDRRGSMAGAQRAMATRDRRTPTCAQHRQPKHAKGRLSAVSA